MQTSELQALKASGILSSAAYIRMQLQATKPTDSANFYSISIKQDFPGSTAAEIFNELANLNRDGKIEGSIPNSFTVTHSDPGLLTSYSPEQVRQLRGQSMFRQKGYLFFCLGADNPGKTSNQLVDPARITQFYGLSMTDFFGELGRLTGDRTITTDIDRISIRWIAYNAPVLQADSSTVAIELERIKTALERLLAEHAQASDPHPVYATDADVLRLSSSLAESVANFSRELDALAKRDEVLAAEVNDKQIKGEYATSYQLAELTRSMLAAIESKQPSGSYAPLNHEQPISSIINLQETIADIMQAIQARQVEGDYVQSSDLQQAISILNQQIETKAPAGNYALQSRLDQAIVDFSRELDTLNSSITTARSVSTTAFQEAIASLQAQITAEDAADTAAIQAAVASLQQGIDARNYVVNQTLTETIATLQTRITAGDATQSNMLQASINMLQAAIDGKQATGDYVPASTLRSAIASLQTAIDSKQIAGDYATTQAVMLSISNLQKAIDSKNYVMGDAFSTAITTLQGAIAGKQAAGDYATSTALTNAIASLQTAISGRQASGDYATHTDLNSYALKQALTDAVASLQSAINGKQPLGNYQPAGNYALSTDLAAYQPKGNYALSAAVADAIASLQAAINLKQAAGNYISEGDARLTDARTPLAHTQAISTITGLQTALDSKQVAGSYAPLSHNQDISTINGLQTALDGKQAAGNYAPANHTQAINTITGLQTALDGKQAVGDYPLRSEIIASPKVTRSLYSANSPANPVIGDVWEAYDLNGDSFDTERWTYNGTYWVSQRRIANWSFNALSAASNFFELIDKYPFRHGILFEWFTIGMKAGASNSASAYATFTLSRRDSSGVSSTLSSFSTSAIAASGRLYSMKDLKVSYPYEAATDAVIALTLTGTPGAMSGSASFSYRYTW